MFKARRLWFLSCLFGSEPGAAGAAGAAAFLSCLFGSELKTEDLRVFLPFLSCLFGSEQSRLMLRHCQLFSELPIRQ